MVQCLELASVQEKEKEMPPREMDVNIDQGLELVSVQVWTKQKKMTWRNSRAFECNHRMRLSTKCSLFDIFCFLSVSFRLMVQLCIRDWHAL